MIFTVPETKEQNHDNHCVDTYLGSPGILRKAASHLASFRRNHRQRCGWEMSSF